MGRNLIRRIRWGNVALAVAGTAAIVFGIVWAFSATPPPVLPGDAPRPLLAQEPIPTLSEPTPTPSPPRKSDKSKKEQRVKPRASRRAPRSGVARRGKARGGEARGGEARGGETPTPA